MFVKYIIKIPQGNSPEVWSSGTKTPNSDLVERRVFHTTYILLLCKTLVKILVGAYHIDMYFKIYLNETDNGEYTFVSSKKKGYVRSLIIKAMEEDSGKTSRNQEVNKED
jgi:hypothetical protein